MNYLLALLFAPALSFGQGIAITGTILSPTDAESVTMMTAERPDLLGAPTCRWSGGDSVWQIVPMIDADTFLLDLPLGGAYTLRFTAPWCVDKVIVIDATRSEAREIEIEVHLDFARTPGEHYTQAVGYVDLRGQERGWVNYDYNAWPVEAEF